VAYEDLAAGVDQLIRRGIADSTRLGIWGHSYGGYVTAHAVAQTHRDVCDGARTAGKPVRAELPDEPWASGTRSRPTT
jgi:dipeptidyl aminopeptidase/acylaminoacyl peptidase